MAQNCLDPPGCEGATLQESGVPAGDGSAEVVSSRMAPARTVLVTRHEQAYGIGVFQPRLHSPQESRCKFAIHETVIGR